MPVVVQSLQKLQLRSISKHGANLSEMQNLGNMKYINHKGNVVQVDIRYLPPSELKKLREIPDDIPEVLKKKKYESKKS